MCTAANALEADREPRAGTSMQHNRPERKYSLTVLLVSLSKSFTLGFSLLRKKPKIDTLGGLIEARPSLSPALMSAGSPICSDRADGVVRAAQGTAGRRALLHPVHPTGPLGLLFLPQNYFHRSFMVSRCQWSDFGQNRVCRLRYGSS